MLAALIALVLNQAQAETRLLVPMSLQRIAVTTNPLDIPTSSPFKALRKKFDRGRTIEIGELRGWYAGRCFFADAPSQAVATLLAADTSARTQTNGPAFSGADYRHITPLVDIHSPATKFDSIASSFAIETVLKTARDSNSYPVRENEEMIVQGYRTTDLESRVYRLRKSGGYPVLRLECAEHDYCSNFSGWISNKFLAYEGEAVAYCYYFRKVR